MYMFCSNKSTVDILSRAIASLLDCRTCTVQSILLLFHLQIIPLGLDRLSVGTPRLPRDLNQHHPNVLGILEEKLEPLHRLAAVHADDAGPLPHRLGPAADASAFDTSGEPAARYPPLALWATPRPSAQAKWATPSSPGPGAGGAEAAERRHRDTYLMVPLNEVVDAHYSVYLCRLAARVARPPPYCLD